MRPDIAKFAGVAHAHEGLDGLMRLYGESLSISRTRPLREHWSVWVFRSTTRPFKFYATLARVTEEARASWISLWAGGMGGGGMPRNAQERDLGFDVFQ